MCGCFFIRHVIKQKTTLRMDKDRKTVLRDALKQMAEKKGFLLQQIQETDYRLFRLNDDLRDLVAQEAVYKEQLRQLDSDAFL
jgi:hypothetical protein